MKRGFRDALASIVPIWLSNRLTQNNGYKFLFSMMLMLDAFVEATRQGIIAAWPGVGTPTADALIGQTRQIIRGLGESDAAYETRLRFWLDTWILAGSPWGLLINILAFLNNSALAAETVDDSGNFDLYAVGDVADPFHPPRHVDSADSVLKWNWDGLAPDWRHRDGEWWRLWLIIYVNGVYTQAPLWGSGLHWGDGHRWGIQGITEEAVEDIRALVGQWKAAHAWVPWIIFAFDNTWFLDSSPAGKRPDGTWGRWGKVAPAGVYPRAYVPSRTATAAYANGVI